MLTLFLRPEAPDPQRCSESRPQPSQAVGLCSGSPQHLCSPLPCHLPCYLKLFAQMPYKTTDWLGQSRSSHTTEDCAEDEQGGRLPRSATSPRGHVGGHRCAHTGSWAVARPRRRRQNAPSRLLLGRGLFTAHVPSRDFWTRAAGMHYPLQ